MGILIAGISILGVSIALIFVPLLSEIIEAVQEKEGLGEDPILNDKASALFNASYATGCIIAPILGGALKQAFGGFRGTCDFMALCSGGVGIIFFFVIILPSCFMKKKKPVVVEEDVPVEDVSQKSQEVHDLCKPMLMDSQVTTDITNRETMAGTIFDDSSKFTKLDNSFAPVPSFAESVKAN